MGDDMVSLQNLSVDDGASDISIAIFEHLDEFISIAKFGQIFIPKQVTKAALNFWGVDIFTF